MVFKSYCITFENFLFTFYTKSLTITCSLSLSFFLSLSFSFTLSISFSTHTYVCLLGG